MPVPATPAPLADQKLIWSVEGVNELPGLDPANPQNAQSIQAINLIFGGLVRLDAQLNVVPDGAESWTISEDGKTYTFTIREGLKFADGTPVTAQHFADSINRALQPETASYGAAFQLSHVVGAADVASGATPTASGIQMVDERTLQITTDDVVPYFLSQLTFPVTFVVPTHLIAEKGAQWTEQAFGTGPFQVKEWLHNQKLVLVPNPYYWAGPVGVAEIELPFIQDSETAYQLYRTGELDIMGSPQNPVPAARIPEVSSSPDFQQVGSFAVRYIGFNNKKHPFDNVNVRSIWGADYPDPQNFISQQLRSDSPNNNGHWTNAQFDEIAKQADTFTGSAEERLKLYNQAEQIAINEVGWLPLFVPRFSVLMKPYVSGIVPTGQGLIVPDWSAVRGRPR